MKIINKTVYSKFEMARNNNIKYVHQNIAANPPNAKLIYREPRVDARLLISQHTMARDDRMSRTKTRKKHKEQKNEKQ